MRNFFVLICGMLLFVACDRKTVVSQTTSLPGSWDKSDTLTFSIPQLDSLKAYNIFIDLRNTNEYPYNNLFVVTTIEFPHGKTITDTLEYKMAYPNGEWMGEGIGSVKENKLWLRENVQFNEKGNYNITITQAVRNNGEVEGVSQLPGITDVGISIEEASQLP